MTRLIVTSVNNFLPDWINHEQVEYCSSLTFITMIVKPITERSSSRAGIGAAHNAQLLSDAVND